MAAKTPALGLTGNQLKLLALLLMTVDHIGMVLLPQLPILRVIGRLSMPIFAWMIAEGCAHTRSRGRYLLTMAAFGAVCQLGYGLFMQSLQMCIFVTFILSILLIYTLELASRKQNFFTLVLLGAVLCAVVYICVFLPRRLAGTGFRIDYGLMGVLLPALIYLGRNRAQKLFLAGVGLCAVALCSGWAAQWYGLLSLPLLALYNGKRGERSLKYFFYIYYPAHLVAIYGISLLGKQ